MLTANIRVALALVVAILATPACAAHGSETPSISNDAMRIDFDAANGRLRQILDRTRGQAALAADSSTALWEIDLGDGRTLNPDDAEKFAYKREDGASRSLTLTWSSFGLEGAAGATVCARVELDDRQPSSRWQFSATGLSPLQPRSVAFPRIGPLAAQPSETLAVPQWLGEATRQPRQLLNPQPGKAARLTWDYPGLLSMQFVAVYGIEGRGLMAWADDTQLLRKQFAATGDGKGAIALEVRHESLQRNVGGRVVVPYQVHLTTFAGDWYTAAALYRNWASQQWWVAESRVRRGLTPAWVRDTALWVWNRGRSAEVLPPALALQQDIGAPVSVFWHWWHGCAYDVGFPEYFPPREGADAFRESVAAAKRQGVNSVVYMNQRLWGMSTASWAREGAAAYAVKDASGEIRPEVYNTFDKAPCASMCMGTSFWRSKYAGLAVQAVNEFGVAGVYMDQACTSLSCYDPSHGHPVGGGAYWMDGFKQLAEDIRTRVGPTVALAGEGCGEGWLPYLDVMLSLQVSLERYSANEAWEPTPLFNAVYHDCATQYGNYSSLARPPYDDLWPAETAPRGALALLDRKFATQFRLEQARAFVWGQQPTIANFRPEQLAERREEIDYAAKLAASRGRALKFLRDGVLLRPPRINPPLAEIPISRLSIYAGQQGAVQERTKTVPMVLASIWQAADGDVGIVLANIADQSTPVRLALGQQEYPIPDNGEVTRVDDTRDAAIAFNGGTIDLETWLGPQEVRIYEISPSREDGDATDAQVEPRGIEPLTSGLQSRRSPN